MTALSTIDEALHQRTRLTVSCKTCGDAIDIQKDDSYLITPDTRICQECFDYVLESIDSGEDVK